MLIKHGLNVCIGNALGGIFLLCAQEGAGVIFHLLGDLDLLFILYGKEKLKQVHGFY